MLTPVAELSFNAPSSIHRCTEGNGFQLKIAYFGASLTEEGALYIDVMRVLPP
jgi:hypothetical protein